MAEFNCSPELVIRARTGEEILVDERDYKKVAAHGWRVEVDRSGKPTVCTDIKIGSRYKKFSLANFIMQPPPGLKTYRVPYSEPLDYRRFNLYLAPPNEFKRLKGKPKGEHSSRYKGVYKFGERWRATIQLGRKCVCLGLYDYEEDAAKAYDEAVSKNVGPHGYRNFG